MSFKLVTTCVLLAVSLAVSSPATLSSNGTLKQDPDLAGNATLFLARFPNQRFYVFNNRGVDFFEALQLCASFGLRLASINTAEDTTQLHLALRRADPNEKGPWWIAGTDLGRQGHFVWINNMKPLGYRTGYVNFAPGEPNNNGGNEHCLEVYESGLWNDKNCGGQRRYICETNDSESC